MNIKAKGQVSSALFDCSHNKSAFLVCERSTISQRLQGVFLASAAPVAIEK